MVAILSKGETNIAVIHLDLSQEQFYRKVKTHILAEELGKLQPTKKDYGDIHILEKELTDKITFYVTIFDSCSGGTTMKSYTLEVLDLDIDRLVSRLWKKFCRK